MSTAMMSAPSAASRTASARPCPRAAPVMNATFPSSLAIRARLGTQLTLGRIARDDGLGHLDVGRAVEMFAYFGEHLPDGRGLAVGLQGLGVRPLFDEDERAVGLVQRVQIAARLVVHIGDGP